LTAQEMRAGALSALSAQACPEDCSGQGECQVYTGECSCFTGWTGADCATAAAAPDVVLGIDGVHSDAGEGSITFSVLNAGTPAGALSMLTARSSDTSLVALESLSIGVQSAADSAYRMDWSSVAGAVGTVFLTVTASNDGFAMGSAIISVEFTKDDGVKVTEVPMGCMDPDAANYDSEAEVDDGSCPTATTMTNLAGTSNIKDEQDMDTDNAAASLPCGVLMLLLTGICLFISAV